VFNLDSSAFDIEFPLHVPMDKREYWLNWVSEKGACVERLSENVYRVSCIRAKQLAYVGWAIYHTNLSSLCKVVAVSGAAEAQANVYTKPPN